MNDADSPGVTPKHDPLAALRQVNFVFYTVSRFFYGTGLTLLQALLFWQVYEISDSPLYLAILGLARLLPSLAFVLVGGAAADTFNRRNIVMVAQSVPSATALLLAIATGNGWVSLPLIYAGVAFIGIAAAFEGPARVALLPAIVRQETFANAVTVSSTVQAFSFVTGPALGGILIASIGVGATYGVFAGLALSSIVSMGLVRYRQPEGKAGGMSMEAIREGVHFVRTHQVLLGAMALDMFAVIFGGVKALLPIYAIDILDVGPRGFGLLNASFEAGAFLMSFVLVMRPPVVRTGRALIWTVVFFGVGTIVFALSRNFYLSLAVYMLIGASDMVSVVMRSTTIQLATPDELRGRVSAVNQVFIQSSNQLNAVESGLVASVFGATIAVVSGGFGALLTVGAVAWRLPALYAYQVPKPAVAGETATEAAADDGPSRPEEEASTEDGSTPAS